MGVVISMTSQIKCFSKKRNVAPINVGLLQKQKRLIHNLTAHGTYNLDGYDIKAIDQNLEGENEWDFYFRNHTVALYSIVH